VIDPFDDRVEIPEESPAVAAPRHPILAGVAGPWPYLLGYNRVRLKPEAVCSRGRGSAPGGDRHGAGRSLRVDVGHQAALVSRGVLQLASYARVWTQAVRWLAGD
jgi:uncharacterized membrane protein